MRTPPRRGCLSTRGHSSGTWNVAAHAAVLAEPDGRIAFQFEARDVNLVMGPTSKGDAIPFRVFLDGAEPRGAVGTDVQPDGTGMLARPAHVSTDPADRRLIKERRFEIEFLERRSRGVLLHVRMKRRRYRVKP